MKKKKNLKKNEKEEKSEKHEKPPKPKKSRKIVNYVEEYDSNSPKIKHTGGQHSSEYSDDYNPNDSDEDFLPAKKKGRKDK